MKRYDYLLAHAVEYFTLIIFYSCFLSAATFPSKSRIVEAICILLYSAPRQQEEDVAVETGTRGVQKREREAAQLQQINRGHTFGVIQHQ